MDRLTEENPLWIEDELWTSAREPSCEEIDELYQRLKAYEDIGLTPEQLLEVDRLYSEKCREVAELKRFKDFFHALYGEGLEIANWHLNGDTEPFDNFYDVAEGA